MRIRPPAVAGRFYPGHARRLAADVADYLALAPRPGARPRAGARAVVPHAGYVYSGPTAGVGYRLLRPAGPASPGGAARPGPLRAGGRRRGDLRRRMGDPPGRRRGWTPTPARLLHAPGRGLDRGRAPRRPRPRARAQPRGAAAVPAGDAAGVPVLPLLVGGGDAGAVAALLLERWWDDRRRAAGQHRPVALPAGRGGPAAGRPDRRGGLPGWTPAAIGDLDACGARPLRAVLRLAGGPQARVRLLDLRTSADTAGDPDRVVGYGAFAVEEGACGA